VQKSKRGLQFILLELHFFYFITHNNVALLLLFNFLVFILFYHTLLIRWDRAWDQVSRQQPGEAPGSHRAGASSFLILVRWAPV
jgi:hypothetical protein